jgi:hypothetical protein
MKNAVHYRPPKSGQKTMAQIHVGKGIAAGCLLRPDRIFLFFVEWSKKKEEEGRKDI